PRGAAWLFGGVGRSAEWLALGVERQRKVADHVDVGVALDGELGADPDSPAAVRRRLRLFGERASQLGGGDAARPDDRARRQPRLAIRAVDSQALLVDALH